MSCTQSRTVSEITKLLVLKYSIAKMFFLCLCLLKCQTLTVLTIFAKSVTLEVFLHSSIEEGNVCAFS